MTISTEPLARGFNKCHCRGCYDLPAAATIAAVEMVKKGI